MAKMGVSLQHGCMCVVSHVVFYHLFSPKWDQDDTMLCDETNNVEKKEHKA